MLASSKKLYVFILFFAGVLLLSLSFLALPAGQGSSALADPGSGWEECSPEGARAIFSVYPVDSSVTWANGIDDQGSLVVYRTTDGGLTWVASFPGLTTYTGSFCRIFALDENTAWLYGMAMSTSTGGGGVIFKTTDGGGTWIEVTSPSSYKFPLRLVAMDENNLWVLGQEVMFLMYPAQRIYLTAYIERSSDGGENWVRQYNYLFYESNYSIHDPTPIIMMPYWFDLEVVDTNTAWCTAYDRLIKTENGGWGWDTKLLSEGSSFPFNVSAVDSATAWVVLGREIMKTCDGGTTWETLYTTETHEIIRDIAAVDDSVAWAILADISYTSAGFTINNGRPLKTIDGGATWLQQIVPVSYSPVEMEAVDTTRAWTTGSLIWLGGGGVILKTSDGGDTGPDVTAVSPDFGEEGDEIVITGCDFGDMQDTSYVSFGTVQATEYTSWSDGEISAVVPPGVEGEVAITVTTPEGTSNPRAFDALETLLLISVAPENASQVSLLVDLQISGTGFMPGASVRLEKGPTVLNAFSVNVISETEITFSVSVFGTEPGAYDVVVTNPDGREARLPGAFTVTSMCGQGSGTALLALGLTLGLLSLAGTAGVRRRKRKK